MRFVKSEIKLHHEEKIYKICMSNMLYQSPRGKMMAKSYAEIMGYHKSDEDNRSGDEIAADIINKIGLEVQ